MSGRVFEEEGRACRKFPGEFEPWRKRLESKISGRVFEEGGLGEVRYVHGSSSRHGPKRLGDGVVDGRRW